MTKKSIIVSYQKLPEEVIEALSKKYPDGIENHVMKIDMGTKNFYAVTVDYDNISYLVKIDVDIDSDIDNYNSPDVGDHSDKDDTELVDSMGDDSDEIEIDNTDDVDDIDDVADEEYNDDGDDDDED